MPLQARTGPPTTTATTFPLNNLLSVRVSKRLGNSRAAFFLACYSLLWYIAKASFGLTTFALPLPRPLLRSRDEYSPRGGPGKGGQGAYMMLIFELDGGSWTAIGPLLEQGRLPNIAGLICRGASGVLRSIPPLLSPAVWTTIYTGQPRERHGVQTFDATSEDVRYKRLWDIAYANGIICGVCGSLVTWPPYNVGGFMIPDIMARDARTIPPQFASLQELVPPGYLLATCDFASATLRRCLPAIVSYI